MINCPWLSLFALRHLIAKTSKNDHKYPRLKPIVVFCTVSQNHMDGSHSSQLFLHLLKLKIEKYKFKNHMEGSHSSQLFLHLLKLILLLSIQAFVGSFDKAMKKTIFSKPTLTSCVSLVVKKMPKRSQQEYLRPRSSRNFY